MMSEAHLAVAIPEMPDTALVSLADRYVHTDQISDLERQINDLLDRRVARNIVLDFRRVEYLPSIMLGTLVVLQKRVRTLAGHLLLAGMQPAIRQLFTVTFLDHVFTIHDDVRAAVHSCRENRSAST